MPRRSGEETRELLLHTAIEMLLERGVSAGVSHIRLQQVVRRAHLTTGAAYRLWADQDDFHRDLAVEVTRMRDDTPAAEIRQVIDDPAAAELSWEELIRLSSAGNVRSLRDGSRDDRLFMVALALRASARVWDDLTRASVERHQQSVAEYQELYAALMHAYGYRMRPPLTLADFTAALAALAEGFAIQSVEGIPHPVFSPGPAADDHGDPIDLTGGEWTLFGLAVRALVESFMTRSGPDDAQSSGPPGPERRA